MRIIVCVKQVPDMTTARMDRESNTIVRDGASSVINAYDLHAVEEALRIRERLGGGVTALSMGIPAAESMLRQMLAMGADEAALLTDRAFAGADSLATSYTLAAAVRFLGGCDLILCGKQTADGDTAQVGPGLAEKLGYADVTNVTEVLEVTKEHIVCRRAVEDGAETIRARLPAVITVSKELNVPRFPNVEGIRRLRSAGVRVLTAGEIGAEPGRIGLSGSPTQVERTFIPPAKAAAQLLRGTPAEQAERLLELCSQLGIRIGEGECEV